MPRRRRTTHDSASSFAGIEKCPTAIRGLDEITFGGLPRGRTTLLCGDAGCGKTLLSMQFLVRGIERFDEPGAFLAFEESAEDLVANCRSLGFGLKEWMRKGKLALDSIRLERSEIAESGDYDLEGLFLRLEHAIDSVGARRVVIDTLESLWGGLSNDAILRSELRRLFRWLKDKGVTTIVTAERGADPRKLTRRGLEEYVSDCVILLDNRVQDQISTRRTRVVKYRGSAHGANEYPFLVDEGGIHVMPITSAGLRHRVSDERVSSGVEAIDEMLGGEGYYRGTTVLVSGGAGTGKSGLAAHFAESVCRRGERCLYFSFEESPDQIDRNMRSMGLDFARWKKKNLLRTISERPAALGLENHLAVLYKEIEAFEPSAVILDPVSALKGAGTSEDATLMLIRLVDHLKSRGVTTVATSLVPSDGSEDSTVGVSSIMDCWIQLRFYEEGGERNRGIHVLKHRGAANSNQVREFTITPEGMKLQNVYVGPEGVLTGSAREAQRMRDDAEEQAREREAADKLRELERRRQAMERRIAELRAEFELEQSETARLVEQSREDRKLRSLDRTERARGRQKDDSGTTPASSRRTRRKS